MPVWWPWSRSRTGRADRSDRLRRYWDKHARSYDRQMASFERVLFGDGRQWICSQAAGDVLEVAIGTGRNLPMYPNGIRLTGVDFSPQMLRLAQRRAQQLGRQVDLRLGDAQALDLPDACFDTVVCTLSLCAIPDQRRAIAEMKRVLRPGGRLLLLDHVAAGPRLGRAIQWLLERVTVPLGGEHYGAAPSSRSKPRGSTSSGESGTSAASWSGSSPANRHRHMLGRIAPKAPGGTAGYAASRHSTGAPRPISSAVLGRPPDRSCRDSRLGGPVAPPASDVAAERLSPSHLATLPEGNVTSPAPCWRL